MLTTLEEKVDPKHTALLVVDMQNDFCHERGVTALNGADVTNAQIMVPRLRHLIDEATRAGMLVAFIRTSEPMLSPWLERLMSFGSVPNAIVAAPTSIVPVWLATVRFFLRSRRRG